MNDSDDPKIIRTTGFVEIYSPDSNEYTMLSLTHISGVSVIGNSAEVCAGGDEYVFRFAGDDAGDKARSFAEQIMRAAFAARCP